MIEYQNIKKRTNLQFLFNKFTIYLNNKKILNFEKSMNQILNSSYFYKLDEIENFYLVLDILISMEKIS